MRVLWLNKTRLFYTRFSVFFAWIETAVNDLLGNFFFFLIVFFFGLFFA